MAEREAIEPSSRKHNRQPPSVPFLWEERPGIAKKNWKLGGTSSAQNLIPPVKLIASVPFNWEEKPGKPLPCFLQPEVEPELATPPDKQITSPLRIMYYQEYHNNIDNGNEYVGGDHAHKQGSFQHNCRDTGADKQGGIFDVDIESFNFDPDDSVGSSTSLMANCLVPSAAISTAIPMQKTISANDMDLSETPSSLSSESDSSTNSYATGISSFVGASFLEYLFPLHTPNSGFLGKAAYPMKGPLAMSEVDCRNFNDENDKSVMVRKPRTLGELIMLSRKMSCQRKSDKIRNENSSMELTISKAFGSCIFGTGTRLIEGFRRKRQQLMLKLL